MHRLIAAALCATVAACNSSGDPSNLADNQASGAELAAAAEDADAIGPMLKAAMPEACAHPLVKAELFTAMEADLGELTPENYAHMKITQADIDEAAEMVGQPVMADFQALEADQAVGALACGVRITVGDSNPLFITYILRPSLEDERRFLIAYPQGGPHALWRGTIAGQAWELAQARLPPEPEPEPRPVESVNAM